MQARPVTAEANAVLRPVAGPAPTGIPGVDVVIVNWNAGTHLAACMESVRNSKRTVDMQRVVVVDNASTDASRGTLAGLRDCQVIRNGTNLGFAAACNQGARGSRADLLLFLNPDVELDAGAIAAAAGYMRSPENAQVGILGIQLKDRHGGVQRSCARFPTPLSVAGAMVGLDRALPRWVPPHFMREWDHGQTRDVDQVMGAFFMVRRSVFEALDGFDERFFVYYEDLDFSLRARRAGWRSVYFAGASARHLGGGSSSAVPVLRQFYTLRSRALYCRKHFGAARALGLLVPALLVEPVSRAVHALATQPGRVRHVLPAWLKFLRWLGGGQSAAESIAGTGQSKASILVYTASKAGTNAFRRGLREAGMTVYKAHALNAQSLERKIARDGAKNQVRQVDRDALEFVRGVLPQLESISTVTIVRESIGRNMSGFFQTLWRHGIKAPYDKVDVAALIELYFREFDHQRPDRWFEKEFGPSLGIDPFQMGFDPEAGHLRFRSGKFDVLLMQIELGNEALSTVAGNFAGRTVEIRRRHRTSDKDYGALYEEFKRRIEFPDAYLERVLNSRVMRTFYSEQQRRHIEAYYRRQVPSLTPLPRTPGSG